jgi:cytochrome P450
MNDTLAPQRQASSAGRCPFHAEAAATPATPATPRRYEDLPQPPGGWPLLGQLPGFDARRTHLILERWAQQLGTPYRFSMGPGYHAVVITDPEVVQHISRQRPDAFTRGGRMQPVMAELGFNGVFSSEGERWRTQRKLVMGSLNANHLKAWLPTLASITGRLAQRWLRAAAEGRVLEMTEELKRYTVDVTSALAFGRNPHTLDQAEGSDHVQQRLELIFPAVIRRAMTPFAYWRWLRLPADRRLDRAVAAVHRYARECIAAARAELPRANAAAPRHALESMLLSQAEQGLSDADIVANVVTLLLAGEDTTAHGLCWTLFYLAQQPALQDAMAAHAQAVLGAADAPPDMTTLAALERFEHLALEAMRLRPVVPFNVLEPVADTVVDGLALPARTKIFALARPAMNDPARFAEPGQYRPERWAAGAPAGTVDTRASLPFGAGARVCPGRALATAEMRLVLAMLLKRFRVELACEPGAIHEVCALTMLPDRLPVRLRPR